MLVLVLTDEEVKSMRTALKLYTIDKGDIKVEALLKKIKDTQAKAARL